MKRLFLSVSAMIVVGAAHGQEKINLTQMPAGYHSTPAAASKADSLTNTDLLVPAGAASQTTGRSVMPAHDANPGNGEMMNSTTNYGQLGNMKTSSSVYYDDQGKVRGSNTSINIK